MNMTELHANPECDCDHHHRQSEVMAGNIRQHARQSAGEGNEPVRMLRDAVNDIPVLRCSGRIVYGKESENLFNAIRDMLQTSPRLILDFGHVTMIDAKGVGALLTLHALAKAKNGAIRLVNVNDRVSRVLRIT